MHPQRQAPAVIPPPRPVASAIPGSEPGPTAAAPRPLRRAFRGETSQVPLVRDFIRRYLHGWPCPVAAVEDIVLCATELAANAVRHSRSGLPGGRFAVQVFLCPGEWVEVTVEDAGGPWAGRDADDGPEYGRGLQIVSVLAAETGIVTDDRSRTVWFRCPWSPHEDSKFRPGHLLPPGQEAAG